MKFNIKPKSMEHWNASLVNIVSLLIGFISVIIGAMCSKGTSVVLISIGSSMVASSLVVFISSGYLIRKSELQDLMDKWGLIGLYKTRSEMNRRTDETFDTLTYNLDVIAFGLRAFRYAKGVRVEEKVQRGLHVRILTMNPDSQFVILREKEENEVAGQIRNTIMELINWVEELKKLSPDGGSVSLKFYDALPLEAYHKQDDFIYTGPYLIGMPSQQTISYEYKSGSIGYQYWERYFEMLWNNPDFSKEMC